MEMLLILGDLWRKSSFESDVTTLEGFSIKELQKVGIRAKTHDTV